MSESELESVEQQKLVNEPQLAPTTFQDFVGQERVKGRLQLAVEAARQRGEELGHVLLVGQPDSGKATLARIIHQTIGTRASILSGMTSGNLNDFVGLLTNLEERDVLFIEEIHALDRDVAEFLCQPMKDFKMDIVIDRGPNARAVRLNLPHFTLIGTATHTQRMPPAFLSSFQIVEEMDPYTGEELAALARRFAVMMRLKVDEGVPEQIASAGCVSPRDVLYRLRHVRDYGRIKAHSQRITIELAGEALKMLAPAPAASEQSLRNKTRAQRDLSIDPLKRRYQVFVSSTYEDLKEERRHALQALLETKCIPTGMELFPAASKEQWGLIKRVIDDCDYYIVIVAGCYGSLGPTGKSYTEMEYDYAVSTGKSVIGFFHSNPDELPGSKLEKSDERRHKLAAFAEKIKGRMCKPWNTPEGLASGIKSAILYAIENDRKPGWIRASDLPSTDAIASLKESVGRVRRGGEKQSSHSEERPSIEIPITVFYRETDPAQPVATSQPPKRYRDSLHLALDDLFLILGPRLATKRPRRTLKIFLEEKLMERVTAMIPKTPGKDLARPRWDLDLNTLERILDIFMAEKLIKIVRPPSEVSTKVPYWEITQKGQQRLAELRVAAERK